MKTVLLVAALALGINTLPVAGEVKRLSDPIASDATSETFGRLLDDRAPVATLAELVAHPERYMGREVEVSTRIAKVCQMKGCFFIAAEGAHSLRVSFLDYGFFVPTDSASKRVTLNAELVAKRLSVDEAAHMNEDLGGGSALAAGVSYELVAAAVRIPK